MNSRDYLFHFAIFTAVLLGIVAAGVGAARGSEVCAETFRTLVGMVVAGALGYAMSASLPR